jgi:hypothetical protein
MLQNFILIHTNRLISNKYETCWQWLATLWPNMNYNFIDFKELIQENSLDRYFIVFLASLGFFKVLLWVRFVFKQISACLRNRVCMKKATAASNHVQTNGQVDLNHKVIFTSNIDSSSSSNNRARFRRRNCAPTTTTATKADKFNQIFNAKLKQNKTQNSSFSTNQHRKVEEFEQSNSLIGVATAAATAATIYMDHKRKNCCGKCCGKTAHNE